MEEQVINESSGNGDILALDEYFGTSIASLEKSALTEDAINFLAQCPEFLPYIVQWFKDSISNKQIRAEWQIHYNKVTRLWRACLHDVKSWKIHIRDICEIFRNLGERGEPLSSTLFNACAGKFLELIDCSTDNMDVTDLLSVLDILCRFSQQSNIAETFKLWAYEIQKLASRTFSFPLDAQLSVYRILMRVISSKEDAHEKAILWFEKWPQIQETLVNYYPNKIDEGSGMFIEELMRQQEVERNTMPQLEFVTQCTVECMLEDSDNVPEVSDRSRLDKSLKVQRNHTISNSRFHMDSFSAVVGTPNASIILPKPSATSTPIERAKAARICKDPVLPLHSDITIGEDFSLPVVPLKKKSSRLLTLDAKGRWHWNIKNHPKQKERWTSFKNNGRYSLGKRKS